MERNFSPSMLQRPILLGSLAFGILGFVLPIYGKQLGASALEIGGLFSAFSIMTVVWGIVGMLVGVLIAAELAWPDLVPAVSWLSYGRLRPLHTNAVIFAFGGCALFATSYYVVQRTSQCRLFAGGLARFAVGLAG